jgi:D-amino peptidase
MKVFVSVDMEGASAITDPEDVLPDGADYQRGRVFMTGDANAAILGAYDAGADEVLVNDSHWIMRNLLLEQLDPRARTIKGFHKSMCMVQGLDSSYDGAAFVGYHSCAGTEGGVLNHTLLGKEIQNVYLNGEPTGETRLNAAYAGHFGIPVLLVAGDDAVCEEARRLLGDVETVAVKDGIDKFTANCLHPQVAQERIREATAPVPPLPARPALRDRDRVELHHDRGHLRAHPRRPADRAAFGRVHHCGLPGGHARPGRDAAAGPAGRPEGDLWLRRG